MPRVLNLLWLPVCLAQLGCSDGEHASVVDEVRSEAATGASHTRAQAPAIPRDVETFIERRTACNHWDGEAGGDHPGREEQVQAARRELRCNEIEIDEQNLRLTHRSKPEILRLLERSADHMPGD